MSPLGLSVACMAPSKWVPTCSAVSMRCATIICVCRFCASYILLPAYPTQPGVCTFITWLISMIFIASAPSAGRRGSIDKFGIDRLEAVGPGQLLKIDFLLGHLFLLCPAAETAKIVVVNFVDGDWARVGIPLLAGGFLAQIELGLGVGGDAGEIRLRDVASFQGRAQPANGNVLARRGSEPLRARAGDQITLDITGRVGEIMCLVGTNLEGA